MAVSARLQALGGRIGTLDTHFLPVTPDPTGSYPSEVYDGVRSLILLSHAEIESYLEEWCNELVQKAKQEWISMHKATRTVVSLMAFSKTSTVPSTYTPGKASITKRIEDAVRDYGRVLFENHGIREENLLTLVLPVGVFESDLDVSWLANMTAFGANRGEIAHKTVSVTSLPDPFDTKQKLTELMVGLEKLDKCFLDLISD